MQHLNYCRDIIRQMASVPSSFYDDSAFERYHCLIPFCTGSQKFLLPVGGRLLVDKKLRALDDSEPLQLPFPLIALEVPFERPPADVIATSWNERLVIFAMVDPDDDDAIVCKVAFSTRFREDELVGGRPMWALYPPVRIPRTGYKKVDDAGDDCVLIHRDETTDPELQVSMARYVITLMEFLNALACSNVSIERSDPKKSGKVKSALPFDSYYILTIVSRKQANASDSPETAHCSPREHLRRGHIRRCVTGAKVWINATIVNAGTKGKISKDYYLMPTTDASHHV